MPRKNLFQKGNPKPPNSGRKKGTPNKLTRDIRQFIDHICNSVEVQDSIESQIVNGERDAVKGFLGIVAHKIGSPKQSVEVGTSPSLAKLLILAATAGSAGAEGAAPKAKAKP